MFNFLEFDFLVRTIMHRLVCFVLSLIIIVLHLKILLLEILRDLLIDLLVHIILDE